MTEAGVSGVPVVDDAGTLVGSISASDLKGLSEERLFVDLQLPVSEYLQLRSPYFKRVTPCPVFFLSFRRQTG